MNVPESLPEISTKRERYWNELTDTEKIERMRDIVKDQQRHIKDLRTMVKELMLHEHGKQGTILTPIERNRVYGEDRGRTHPDQVHF